MRKAIFAVIFVMLFIVACKAESRETVIKQQEGVKLYFAMNDNVKYSDVTFTGDEAKSIGDLAKAECPQGVGSEFARITLDSKASSLVIYTSLDGKNITCSVLKPKDQKQIVINKQADAPDKNTAVVVNGKTITITQVQQAVAALPQSTPRDANAVNLAVNQLINDELLRQEADKMSATDKEIADAKQTLLDQANVTEAQAQKNLESQNKTMKDFDDSVRQQVTLQKLLDQRLLIKDFQVTEEDAKSFYLQNPNQFLQSEQAMARFILISSTGRTADQGRGRAQELAAKLNTTDFCALVKQYSDDTGSKDKCGVYVIPRGTIDANLELAAFSTPENQTSVVTTNAGIYFVQTIQRTPAQVVPFPQVAGTLQSNLRNAIFQQRLNLYLGTLRAQADIVSYLG